MPTAQSKAQLGYGATFSIGTGSPVTYGVMAEIASVSFADYTISEIDVTHLQSPNTTEEAIPGMIKLGTIEMTGNFIGDTSQMNVDTLAIARTIFPWKIAAPMTIGQFSVVGTGFITKKEIGPMEPNKKVDFKVSIRATGVLTYTVGP
jgi:predicted secreted protein